MLSIDDFDYALPPELIAQRPARARGESRLLRVAADALEDRRFAELPGLLSPGDLLVVNDTRVIRARLLGEKDTGGRVEVLVERVLSEHEAIAQVRASKAARAGAKLRLAGALDVEVVGREGEFFRLRFGASVPDALERHGSVPLPPYIERAADDADAGRYQTVYARRPGAVAAPTAGLHFDRELLGALERRGVARASVTLHVGAGTFQPVRVRDLAKHRMHAEWYDIPEATVAAVAAAKRRGGRVVAVGTTTVRCLEGSAAAHGTVVAGAAETDLFITPGFEFRVIDRLITNFHLPKSTLLVLVSAFAGVERMRRAYAHAIERGYRFYSYGDAMLVDRIHR
ncbi:MAG TPA: tRNA preQ1(34) S-adenosylmethionine ribosyltransferase-isomerase QueA [Burkholderiales bacterium]|nr:tRNA preQ1(34) S-adenosylmethionine ribosyltransferase-isomerase QueA [Burkholderiales bacterium]